VAKLLMKCTVVAQLQLVDPSDRERHKHRASDPSPCTWNIRVGLQLLVKEIDDWSNLTAARHTQNDV